MTDRDTLNDFSCDMLNCFLAAELKNGKRLNVTDAMILLAGSISEANRSEIVAEALKDGLGGIAKALEGLTQAVKTATLGDELLGVGSPIMKASENIARGLEDVATSIYHAAGY